MLSYPNQSATWDGRLTHVLTFHLSCCFRSFPLLGDTFCIAKRYRLFPYSSLYPQYPDCDIVVGELLAQYRRYPSSSVHGSTDRSHNDHTINGCQLISTAGLLHKGHRLVDVHLSSVCVRWTTGVRCC